MAISHEKYPLYIYEEKLKGKKAMFWGNYSLNPLYPNMPIVTNTCAYPYSPAVNLWANMNDRMAYTHFGIGEDQQVMYPSGYTPLEYHLASNMDWYLKNDPLLLSLGNANYSEGLDLPNTGSVHAGVYPGFMNNNSIFNPGNNNPADRNSVASDFYKKSMVGYELGSLTSAIANLENILTMDGLNETQKGRLRQKLEEMKQLEKQINILIENQSTTYAQCDQAIKDIKKMLEDAKKLGDNIGNEIASKANPSVPSAPGSPSSDGLKSVSEEDIKKEVEKKQKKLAEEAAEITTAIYKETKGQWSTDWNKINNATKKINKDNVCSVLNNWKYEPDLIQQLFSENCYRNGNIDDQPWGQKFANPGDNNSKQIWNIVCCLQERAKELGIYNELSSYFNIAYDELDDTCINEGDVCNAVKSIVEVISQKEQEYIVKEATEAAEKTVEEENKKIEAENKKKQDKEEKEIKNQFIADLRESFNDDEAEISNKIEYKDGYFQIRIEGNTYYGKDFNELKKEIKNAGYEPEKYLKKQQLAAVA